MFYTFLLLGKRGALSKIWIAAHWEKKLTKAHIFECNLDSAIQSIMAPKVVIALRTSGHLLLGVVRIYHRKAKYLLADCNEAFLKIKITFRPGALDLAEEHQEASYNAITLPEEFHEFETPLPDLNVIDVVDHFTLNQSRVEDITIREDYGRQLILYDGFDNNQLFVESTDPCADKDDGKEVLFPTSPPVEEQHLEAAALGDDPREMSLENLQAGNNATLLSNEEDGFVLEPVDVLAIERKKRRKRKRKLIVDNLKEIPSSTMRQQLITVSDTIASLDIAPPMHSLMERKLTGGVQWLLSHPTQPIINTDLLLLFTQCLKPDISKHVYEEPAEPEIETLRKEHEEFDIPQLEMTTLMDVGSSCTEESSNLHDLTAYNQTTSDVSRSVQEETVGLLLCSSPRCLAEEEIIGPTEIVQDSDEQQLNKRTHEMLGGLRKLNQSGVNSFSLQKLCKNNSRKQVSAQFYSFLVLKKQSAIKMIQSDPYSDIIAIPGPRFHTL
ncbi:double-strand-break repair protein rad21-like protein 1 isoform X3 [Mixophyes fleayi]|uniref:double-strand-break repair protein rad21-like protein 1 isoform X3 n=1 Tax=Mixophyes fleayi TaxID=3061075 RepID=UPI003F4DD101